MNAENNSLKHFKVIFIGLMISLLMVLLDSTITNTAMPKIIASLSGLEYYVWPVTIYLTTLVISAMLSGRLSDFYGSKKTFIGALIIFMLGSVLCGFSQNMVELIIFRALQGLGAGIIATAPLKIVAELLPPRQRGKYLGMFMAAGGIASVAGPTLGGYITDTLGWPWIFFVNVPIGIMALSLLIPYLPELGTIVKEKIMDYWGIITFTSGLISFLIALTLIEENKTISVALVVSLILFAGIMLLGFVYAEKRAKEPILPMYLFKNSVFSVSNISMFLAGAVMLAYSIYIPFFLQSVQGMSPSVSGTYLIPLMFSMMIASILAGQIISKTGKYKNIAIMSFAIGIIGMLLLSTLNADTTLLQLIIYEVIVGVSAGIAPPLFTAAAQNAVAKRDIGVVTSSIMYFRYIGGIICLAILGAIVNMTLNLNLQTSNVSVSSSLLVTAIHNVFIIAAILNIIGFVLCFFLKDLHMSNEMEEINYEEIPGEDEILN